MKTLVVDDDPDLRMLLHVTIAGDSRFEIIAEAATADDAIEMVLQKKPILIILDHLLDGDRTGLEVAPVLKAAAPEAKVILFTGYDHLHNQPGAEAIDAFLLKTDLRELLPLAQRLLGLDPLN